MKRVEDKVKSFMHLMTGTKKGMSDFKLSEKFDEMLRKLRKDFDEH